MEYRQRILRLVGSSGISEIIRKIWGKHTRFVLMMHGITKRRYQELDNQSYAYMTLSELKKILFWLSSRYDFLSPEEFLYSKKPGVLLTFDDGYENNFVNVIPTLVEYSAPAVFFVTLQHILDPYKWLPAINKTVKKNWKSFDQVPNSLAKDIFIGMNVEQLQESSRNPLITIGSHTITHPFLSSCNDGQLNDEVRKSKLILEDLIKSSIDLFAYPTGDYNSRVVEAVMKAEYKAAFATDSKHISCFQYEIPRIGLYASDNYYLSLKLSGLHRRPLTTVPVIS